MRSGPNGRPIRMCLACGKPLESVLDSLGSLRCLDCREKNRELDPLRVAEWQKSGSRV